jgi:hypothetical protein
MENKLELRMYGLVPYNISPIQQAIQYGHAVVEYGQMVKNNGTEEYDDWADNWKTFIILNGGTSNHSVNRYGTEDFVGSMETHLSTLEENGIRLATFFEPDLNDMLSAIVFIVDERVFNKKVYLEFGDWVMENHMDYLTDNLIAPNKIEKMRKSGYFEDASPREKRIYDEWKDFVGGEKNVFLRDFLNGFRLA